MNKTYISLGALLIGAVAAGPAAGESHSQMPATKHQAEVVPKVERETAQRPPTEEEMPVSKHQKQAIRDFEAADTNRDGSLSKDEYAAYMEQRAGELYYKTLAKPEKPGVDAAGPRDRKEAEGSSKPIPATDPTVAD